MSFDLAAVFTPEDQGKRRYGVIGWPVEHSLSPAMHNAALKQLKIKDAVYRAIPVPPTEFPVFAAQAAELPLHGFNATIPFKEQIHASSFQPLLDASVGGFSVSVNTMVRADNRPGNPWIAYSTDGDGFLEDLKEKKVDVKGKSILLLGAGGAATALLGAFSRRGFPAQVTVVNRTAEKARKLRELAEVLFRVSLEHTPFELVVPEDQAAADLALREADIVVNTTSVGLQPAGPDDYAVDLNGLRIGQVVYDLIYHRKTELLKAAPDAKKAFGGLGMLVHQGARAFEIWFNRKPPVDAMRRAAEEELKRRQNT